MSIKYKILNLLAEWYENSWLFMKFTYPVNKFKEEVKLIYNETYKSSLLINNELDSRLYRLIRRKQYNIIPLSYKYKIIDTIINENTN